MTTKRSLERDLSELGQASPGYWVKMFAGTPVSVVVPPYIRFLQGILVSRKARFLLAKVRAAALEGHSELSPAFDDLEQSPDTRSLGLSYETFFASQLTVNLVSEVEHFIGSAVGAALRIHPEKMGGQTFKLLDILSAASTDELVDRAASAVLNEIMYERPNEYIKRLATILSIDPASIQSQWPGFVELKARRDLGIHNNWVVNAVYLRKLKEVGIDSPHKVGDQIVPNFAYVDQANAACGLLIQTLADLLGEKWIRIEVKEGTPKSTT